MNGGEVVPFETPILDLFKILPGVSNYTFQNLIKRLELSVQLYNNTVFIDLPEALLRSINVYLSQSGSINTSVLDYEQKATVRYYLIKAYRGRCQALGKPSRGQRTWSNANTSFRAINHIKTYIAHFKKTHIKIEAVKKINYRIVQRKTLHTGPKFVKKSERKPLNIWL